MEIPFTARQTTVLASNTLCLLPLASCWPQATCVNIRRPKLADY